MEAEVAGRVKRRANRQQVATVEPPCARALTMETGADTAGLSPPGRSILRLARFGISTLAPLPYPRYSWGQLSLDATLERQGPRSSSNVPPGCQ
uniref:Uncharacterized protein n=1 Tax=Plectus sambesii TaxID=2011161 RepID=A0A914V7U9_9BILA